MFILTRLICGIAAAMLMPAAISVMTQNYPREEFGGALGRAFGLTMIVTALTPVAMGVVVGAVGFAWAYVPMIGWRWSSSSWQRIVDRLGSPTRRARCRARPSSARGCWWSV